jgi:hypothetical protein
MIKNQKNIKTFYALLMLLATSVSFAQDEGFDEEVIDNASPIDTNIWLLLLVGLGYVFYKYRSSMKYNRL